MNINPFLILLATMLCPFHYLLAQQYTTTDLANLTFTELDSIVFSEYSKGSIQPPVEITHYSQKKAHKQFGKLDSVYTEYTNRMGFFLHIAGQLEDAEAYFIEALALKEQVFGKEHTEYGMTLNNLAAIYLDLGNYKQAEPLFLEAIAIQEEIWGKEHYNYIQSIVNLAAFYIQTEQYQKAQEIYRPFFEGDNPQPMPPTIYYQVMHQYASTFISSEDYQQAEYWLLKAIAGKEQLNGKNHPTYVKSLINIAKLYIPKKQTEKATDYLNQAEKIQIGLTGTTHPSYLTILQNLIAVDIKQQKYKQAIDKIEKGLQINNKNKTPITWNTIPPNEFIYPQQAVEFIQLWITVLNNQYQKQPTSTLATQIQILSRCAIDVNIYIKNTFQLDADKIRLLKQNNYFALMGIQSSLKLEGKKKLQQAFNFAEQNKSILLADALRGTKARQMGHLPDSIAAIEKQLQKQAKEIQKSILQAKDSTVRSQLIAQSGAISIEIDAFQKQIQYEYPSYFNLKYKRTLITVEEIQKNLPLKTALLEYFVSKDKTYLFVVTRDTIETFSIPIAKVELKKHTRLLRKALSDYKFIIENQKEAFNRYKEEASWFYENWVRIALQHKSLDKLIIVTDDVLGHLPFEVFLTTKPNEKTTGEPNEQVIGNYAKLDYLVHQYAISYNYSATLWKQNQNIIRSKNNSQMLALAADYPALDSARLRLLRSSSDYNLRQVLSPIPKVKDEVAALKNKFKGSFWVGTAANERAFKSSVKNYNVIHLAMHGILDVRTPILSSLAFTENYDSTENNFLHTDEIAALATSAQLVTLSACETGYGKFEQGEGIISLARSFSYAGVPALVVSLWQVNDQSTAILMPLFYENIANGMTKDKALQQAKLDYIKHNDGITAHPAFWSAFIQLGDSSSIALHTKSDLSAYWWLLLIIVPLMVVVLWWWRKKTMPL